MEHEIQMNKEIEVDGWRYLASHPNPEIAWEIGVELTKYIAEPMASMSLAAGNPDRVSEALSLAVRSLLKNVDSKQSLALVKRILSFVEVQGKSDGSKPGKFLLNGESFKSHFHGKLGSMIKLLGEVIAFTHEDFFLAIADGVASLMKRSSEVAA